MTQKAVLSDTFNDMDSLPSQETNAPACPGRTHVRAVIAMLVCRDGASEIEFCNAAFDAVELSRRSSPDGTVVHATLTIGEAVVMVHGEVPALLSRAPEPDGSSPVVIYLYVENADATIARAVASGARILIPAANQFWGDRVGRIIDPSGHVWNVASRGGEEASSHTRRANLEKTNRDEPDEASPRVEGWLLIH